MANTHEENWFASTLHHVDCSANFLIHSVELGQHDAIDASRILLNDSEIDQALIEFGQLVDSIISDKGFTDE